MHIGAVKMMLALHVYVSNQFSHPKHNKFLIPFPNILGMDQLVPPEFLLIQQAMESGWLA